MNKKQDWRINAELAIYAIALVMLFFGMNFIQEFSVDTYSMFEVSQWKYLLEVSGRVVTTFVIWIFEQLALPGSVVYFISWGSAILFLSFAVYILSKMIYKMTGFKLLSAGIAFLTIANTFSIEYFLFIEKGIFMLALFLNVLAVYYFEKFMTSGKRSGVIIAFICLLVAVFIYQTSLGLFVIISLPFIVKNSENVKRFTINCFSAALLYGINMFLAFFVVKIYFNTNRISDDTNIFESIQATIPWLKTITVGMLNILPQNFFAVMLLGGTIAAIICSVLYSKNKLRTLSGLLFIVIGCYVVGFLPYFLGISNAYSPRIIYPFASVFGVILIYCCIMQFSTYKLGYSTICVGLVMMLSVQYFSFTEILIERYKVNQTDKYLTEIIAAEIQEYEIRTGVGIRYICFYSDQSITYCYPGLNTASFLSVRAHGTSWSDLNSLNHLLGTSYEQGTRNNEYADYFARNNWDVYDNKQLIFDGDTLHICAY